MDCCSKQKRMIIVRGDDTGFGGKKFLSLHITSRILDLSNLTAKLDFCGVTKTFTDLTQEIVVNYSATESASFPLGNQNGVLRFFDRDDKKETITSVLPFKVISLVTSESKTGGEYTLNFDIQEGGSYTFNLEVTTNVTLHNLLTGRDEADCHPMSAISGLESALEGKQDVIQDLETIRAGAALGASSVQSVTTGESDGTISVDGNDISVKGLGSAAYTPSTDYDQAGAASTAEQNAKDYADGLSSNYATAAQGLLAESAVQSVSTGSENGTISVDGADVSVKGLGSAAYTPSTDYATSAQGAKADTAIQPEDNISKLTNDVDFQTYTQVIADIVSLIVNNTTSTDANKILSAAMGKSLQDQINNLLGRGKYLSIWDCTTGLAMDDPPVNPYTYETGSFFIVGKVASAGGTNYRPNGATYDKDVPSTTVETGTVKPNDTYYYDGTVWRLLDVPQMEVAFSTLAGSPYDNDMLAAALNGKQALIDATHKLSSDLVDDSDKTNKFVTAQEKTTWNNKQGELVSGTNIKTINNTSILGPGNISVATSAQGAKADTAVQPSSLSTVATSGNYSDLNGKPTIPTVNNSTITVTQGGVTKGSFTLNQASDQTIVLNAGGGGSVVLTDIAQEGKAIEFGGGTVTNYNIAGSPTISSDYIASGFGDNDWLALKETFNPGNDTWEIVMKFKPYSMVERGGIFDRVDNVSYGVRIDTLASGQLYYLVADGSLSYIFEGNGANNPTLNAWNWVKLEFTGTKYNAYLSSNGTTWTLDKTFTSSSKLYSSSSPTKIGRAYQASWGFDGEIDLKECYIKRNGTEVWRAVKIGGSIQSINVKVASSVDSTSTNDEVVGAKLFHDTCGDIETLINAL